MPAVLRSPSVLALLLGALASPGGQARAQSPGVPELCADRAAAESGPTRIPGSAGGELPSLYCVELVATPRVGHGAAGVVELGRASSPFGVTVTPDGIHAYDLTAWIDGLPDPSTLGPYETYVAWATTLVLDPVVRLGEVGNGENALGRVAFNKFMILISAEASADVEARDGPLIMRGRSPSSLMVAHDMLAQAPSAEQGMEGEEDAGDGWEMPPTYPRVRMLPGMADLTPRVSPLTLFGAGPEGPSPSALPEATDRRVVELPDGGTLDLTAGYVRRTIQGQEIAMLAFNGQHPGPLIRVRQASTIFVNFTNDTPFPTTVHWHGLRLDNRFDGVPGVTQESVEPGETFRYRIRFPDAGLYWYHPHHREDVQQELGLYGNMLVEPLAEGYYGPVNREEVLMLDDLLLGPEGLVPFGREASNYMLMGRFGNVFLVNGEPGYALEVGRGEVVRFFLTNASNTRTFNLSFVRKEDGEPAPGAAVVGGDAPPEPSEPPAERLPLKVVASDVSRFEREARVRNVVLSPAERFVVEARFEEPGAYALVNHVQGINHRQGVFLAERTELGTVRVGAEPPRHDHGAAFRRLRTHDDVVAEIDGYRDRFDDPPDRRLDLSLEVDSLPPPVEQAMLYERSYFNPVEWTGTMPMMNWVTSSPEVRWILRDPETGRENMAIDWRHRVGDVIKVRLRNDRNVFHGMQHPLHIHGQRFLVLERNGVPNDNLVWKDTVLLPAGSTTDILLEISNPGRWMVHCHIAEHLESGMKFVLDVEEDAP